MDSNSSGFAVIIEIELQKAFDLMYHGNFMTGTHIEATHRS